MWDEGPFLASVPRGLSTFYPYIASFLLGGILLDLFTFNRAMEASLYNGVSFYLHRETHVWEISIFILK